MLVRAVVLSGGGSKGAYEIGVWKALRKLHISYDIVTGTSVGALNAAFMVQKDYIKGLLMWYNLKSDMVYDSSMEIKSNKDFIKYAKKIVSDKGIAVDNLEATVKKHLNVRKVYKSNIDLGIVTVKFPSLKPIELTKKDIPRDKLADYLVASASCFPAFPMKKIGGEDYIDGGFYDNLPINLAISMGSTEVIAVDLDAIGIKKRVKDKNIPIRIISPKSDTGSFLVFDKITSRKCISLGYNDTMKSFGKLDGEVFTFKKGSLHSNYLKYKDNFMDKLRELLEFEEKGLFSKIVHLVVYDELLHTRWSPSSEKRLITKFNEIVENVGRAFKLDEAKIYSMSKYHKELLNQLNIISKDEFTKIDSLKNNSKIKRLFHDDLMVAYLYNCLVNHKDIKEVYNLISIFPNDFLCALYLYVVYNCR